MACITAFVHIDVEGQRTELLREDERREILRAVYFTRQVIQMDQEQGQGGETLLAVRKESGAADCARDDWAQEVRAIGGNTRSLIGFVEILSVHMYSRW